VSVELDAVLPAGFGQDFGRLIEVEVAQGVSSRWVWSGKAA